MSNQHKKILTPTDLNKNWSVKTLIHSEFHACMKQSKLKIFINFLAGSNSEAIQHRMLAEEFLNPLNATGVYIRLIFTSRERERRIYTPAIYSGPYRANRRSLAAVQGKTLLI